MNRLCFYQKPICDINSYYDMIDLAAKFGHDSIEGYSMFEFKTPDFEKAKQIREYADSKNVKFCCISVGVDFSKIDYDEGVAILKDYAKIAQIIGSPYLHHTIIAEFRNPERVLCKKDEFFELGIRAVREVYDFAKTLGVRTIFEDQGFIFNGVKGVRKLLDTVDRDIALVADFGNIAQSGDDITEFIKAFPDKIAHVHIKDVKITDEPISQYSLPTVEGKYMTDTKLGTGDVKLKEALSLLKQIGYSGYMSAEFIGDVEMMKDGFALINEYSNQ